MTIKFKRTEQLKLPTAILGADIRSEDQQVIAACFDGIYQFHAEDNSKTAAGKKIAEHESYASGARWLNDNHWVTAGYDGNLLFSELDSADPPSVIDAHKFWSWHLAVSPQRDKVASCTGQYLAGGYKYEPAEESEPCVKVFDIHGELQWSFSHVPSVHTVSFSSDGQLLAAANLMGEVRVWDLTSGDQVAQWTTSDFTSWGIIKSHCYIGGIHASAFHRSRPELFVAGMGPMRDPMAGNGKQRWQAFE